MSTMGVWATIHSGVTVDIDYMTVHFGIPYDRIDSLATDCSIPSVSTQNTQFYDTKLRQSIALTPATVGGYLDDPLYSDYKLLNPYTVSTDYLVITEWGATMSGTATLMLTGYFSGFYSKQEMIDALDALYNSMTYKISSEKLAEYEQSIIDASLEMANARLAYETSCAYIKVYDAKASAIAEIDAAMEGITDATLQSTVQGYKNQINAVFLSLTEVANYKNQALAAIDAYKQEQEAERLRLLAEAKEAAIAEINTALGDITDATLLATIQGYKDQINAATVIEAIAPIKTNALATIDAYKAEQERLRLLAEAKEAAIASIQALISGSTDELVISTANKYIALIEAATVIEDVAPLRSEAESVITSLLTEPNGLTFGFIGTGNPIETQHRLEGLKMTYSEDGEDMTVTINGADVTYPLSQVSGLTYFRGTPTVSLTPHENPADPGYYYTTFYSGLETYAIPEDVKAFTAELTFEGDALIVTQITNGVLPQDEGVLLESTSADAITLEATDPASGNKAANNSFEGADVQIAHPAGSIYVISAANSVMAFYKYTGSVIPANKAYIHIPSGQQAPARIIWNAHGSSTGGGITTDLNNTASAEPVEKFIQNGTLYIRKGAHVYNVQGVLVR